MTIQDVSKRLLSTRAFLNIADAPSPEMALENVETQSLADGALCWVLANSAGTSGLYVLDKASTVSADGDLVANTPESSSGANPGRWLAATLGAGVGGTIIDSTQIGANSIPANTLQAAAIEIATATLSDGVIPGQVLNLRLEANLFINQTGSSHSAGIELVLTPTPGSEVILEVLSDMSVDNGNSEGVTQVARAAVLNYAVPAGTTALEAQVRGWDADASGGWDTAGGTIDIVATPAT